MPIRRQAACLFTQCEPDLREANAQTDANHMMGHAARAPPQIMCVCDV